MLPWGHRNDHRGCCMVWYAIVGTNGSYSLKNRVTLK